MVVAELDVQRLVDLQDYDEFTGRGGARNYVESLLLTGFLFERRPRETLAAYIRKERAFAKGRETEFARLYDYRGDAFRRDFADYVRSLKRG